ncbi:MAG: hypothetical protein Q9220_006743 [cf. Caloplaca sp. 1 TL-2023]
MSNPGNIVGGHKANLNNPNTSEESKQHSKEVLDSEFNGGNVDKSGDKNPQNVAGGLKASVLRLGLVTLNNPQVSQDAKDSAKERLEGMGQ